MAAVLALFGALLVYLDSQTAAERRMNLSHGVPELSDLSRLHQQMTGRIGAEVLASGTAGEPIALRYRQGLTRKSVVVFPLFATGQANGSVLGYGFLPGTVTATVEGRRANAEWHGLTGAPRRLSAAAERAMRRTGLSVADAPLPLALFDAPREVVLARPVVSAWRAVVFWLAAAALVASYILKVERVRIDTERSRMAVANRWKLSTPAPAVPETAKAQSRFDQIVDAEDGATPVEADPEAPLAYAFLQRLLAALPIRKG